MRRKMRSGMEGVWIQKNDFRVSSTHVIKLEVRTGWNWEHLPITVQKGEHDILSDVNQPENNYTGKYFLRAR